MRYVPFDFRMNRLKRGNLVVVEHEEAVMRAADCLSGYGTRFRTERKTGYSGYLRATSQCQRQAAPVF